MKFDDFTEEVRKVVDILDDGRKKFRNKIQDFKDEYQVADEIISTAIKLLPSPFNSLAEAIYKGAEGSAEDRVNEVKKYFEDIQKQGEDHYNNLLKLFGDLKNEYYQSYGLNWLPFDYFKDKTATERDLKDWEEGFEFSLTAIKNNLEYRREKVLDQINERLKNQNKLLLLGEAGLGKTTILQEVLCHYFDEKGFLILYNWGVDEIKRGDKLVEFIGALLNEGIKILVIVDNVHREITTTIFYIIDQLSSHIYNKKIYFLLAARLPDFNSLQERLDQTQQGRESLRKFRNDAKNIFLLKNFEQNEIEGFITKYVKNSVITIKSRESNKPTTIFVIDEQSIKTLSVLILDNTDGHPILVKFFLFGQGLRTDVERRYENFLHANPNRIRTMVVSSLLDISNLQITDRLLESMQLLSYARQLVNATLSYDPSKGTWKTIHARWDEELLSLLYEKTKAEGLSDGIEFLEQAKDSLYKVEEIVYPVIGTVYEIAAQGIIPIDNVNSTFKIDSLEDKEKITDLYVSYIGFAYFRLGRYNEALKCYDKALEIDPEYAKAYSRKGQVFSSLEKNAEALEVYDTALEIDDRAVITWHNKGIVLEKLGRDEEALKCYDKALEIDDNDSYVWYSKAMALEKLGRDEEALKCYDKTVRTGYWTPHIGSKIEGLQSKLERNVLDYYDKAIQQDGSNAKAWCYKGMYLDRLRQYHEALKCYDKALEIDDNYVEALHGKAVVLSKLQNLNEALKYYDKALEIDDSWAPLWYNKANTHFVLKQYHEALKCYDKASELDQKMILAVINKGTVLDLLGKEQEALKCYDKALEIDDNISYLWYNKGIVLEKLGRDEEALKCYDKALYLDPQDRDAMNKRRMLLDKLNK